jgi:glycosyltransferase involved in cell wall biosynthesis
MNILYDDVIFFSQRYGGVSRIFVELLRHGIHHTKNNILFRCIYSENAHIQELGMQRIKPYLNNLQFPLKGKLMRGLLGTISHQWVNNKLRNEHIDIFHPTFYSNYFFNSINPNKTKFVFTLHDLTHEKINHPLKNIKSQNLQRADHIICVSHATKEEMFKYYPFTKQKEVSVIYLAQSLPNMEQKIADLPKQYILFVGERTGYKNFNLLLNAFTELSAQFPLLYLVCSGRPFTLKEKSMLQTMGVQSKVIQKSMNDAELVYAYRNTQCFVFPSTYEGFGIPVLEALSCGAPVLLNDISVFKEVGASYATYFQNDLPSLVSAIKDIVMQNHLIDSERGITYAKDFSWNKHAQTTFDIYQSLCPTSF